MPTTEAPTKPTPGSQSEAWTLGNADLRLQLAPASNGGLQALIDLQTGRNFIAAPPQPLYRLTLFAKGKALLALTSLDAERVDVKLSTTGSQAGPELTLAFGRHRGLDLRATCRVRLEEEAPLSRWSISIHNETSYGVRAVHYPVVCAPAVLGEAVEDDVYVWGFMGGNRIRQPGRSLARYPGMDVFRSQHPGIMSVQMQAYYDDEAGLYQATYDASGSVKAFSISRRGEAFDLSIEHNYDETPGLSFDLPYETALGVFHGDWYAAADVYKQWAVQQHWCAKKTTERDDIPTWVKEPRPVLFVGQQGVNERFRGTLWSPPSEYPMARHYPASKVPPLMRGYAEYFGSPVITFMEGWEQFGSPSGPVDIFPPAEGEASFKAAMAQCAQDGNYPALYLAGFQWCYKRAMANYDGREQFEREGRPLAAINAEGEVEALAFWNNQKHYANLCMASPATQQLYFDNLMKLMDLGGVGLQIDQQIGLYTQVCYSQAHGHPPGYGAWMYREMLAFIRRARAAIQARDPQATFSYEVPCEVWIQEVDLHMDRPYHIRPYHLDAIPLFDYLYHEYALTFGGDTMLGVADREVELMKHALIFTLGSQHLINAGQPEWQFEHLPEFPGLALMNSLCQAQRTYARPYVVLGQMLRPPKLEVRIMAVDLWRPSWMTDEEEARNLGTADIPAVWHSLWKSPEGRLGYVLANWTGQAEPVTLHLATNEGTAHMVTSAGRSPVDAEAVSAGRLRLTVPARSALLLEQGA